MVKFYNSLKRSELRLWWPRGWILSRSRYFIQHRRAALNKKNGTASRLCRKDQRHTSEMFAASERHGQYHKMLMYLFGEFRDKSLWTGKASWSEKGKVKAEYYVEHMVRDLWDSNHRLLSSNCVPDSVLTIWNILIKKRDENPCLHYAFWWWKAEKRRKKN